MKELIIESKRLILRKISRADYFEIAKILQDIKVMYAWEKIFSDNEVETWIDENIKRYDNEGYSYFLAINKDRGNVVGVIGPLIEKINNKSFVGIAYILNAKSWGKGYAVEGANACIKYAFDTLKVKEVIAQIRPNNINSINVSQKLNMKLVDKYIKLYEGKEMEHLIYSIKRKEYKG